MINIDWSYAPCGATHFHKGDIMYRPHWRKSGFYCDLGLEAFGWIKDTYPSPISECIKRPKKQEAWIKGELPPAGTECEFTHTGHGVYGRWIRCAVIGYPALTDRVVVETDDALWVESSGIACLFNPKGIMWRPIKTAEQLAEEEKKKVIDDMQRIYEESMLDCSSRLGHASRPAIKALYEAGYRKQ